MRGYALTCLALVLGRLDPRRLEEVLKDTEPELLQTLMNQVCILYPFHIRLNIYSNYYFAHMSWNVLLCK